VASLDPVIAARVRLALQALEELSPIEAAYVFGSQADRTADEWSDIDVAAFICGVEKWDVEKRAEASAHVQQIAGDDIEIHLFPAALLASAPQAGFAEYVKLTGIPMDTRP
jgi:predicted nucleotidyltransferase